MDCPDLSPGRIDRVSFEQTQPRQELNLANNPLSSLRFLSQFSNLTVLNISNANLNDKLLLQIPRSLIRTLRELDISENRLITSISPLPDFPLLTRLNLNNTGLSPNSSRFKQCFHSLEKLWFSNTEWNSVQVWNQLEHNRAGDDSDTEIAACQLASSQLRGGEYSVNVEVSLGPTGDEIPANVRVYQIDSSSIEQLSEDDFTDKFQRQIQVSVNDINNHRAENVYIAVAIKRPESFQLALFSLQSSEKVQIPETIQNQQRVLDSMYRSAETNKNLQPQSNHDETFQFVRLVENQPVLFRHVPAEAQLYKSLLTGRQIISHIKSLLLSECDGHPIDSESVMSLFYEALQSSQIKMTNSESGVSLVVQLVVFGQKYEYEVELNAAELTDVLEFDRLYTVYDQTSGKIVPAPQFVQGQELSKERTSQVQLFEHRDKFVVTVEIDYDPDSIVYSFVYNGNEIQVGCDPYLYGEVLLTHSAGRKPYGQLVCKIQISPSNGALISNTVTFPERDDCRNDLVQQTPKRLVSKATRAVEMLRETEKSKALSHSSLELKPQEAEKQNVEESPTAVSTSDISKALLNKPGYHPGHPENDDLLFSQDTSDSSFAKVFVMNKSDSQNQREIRCVVRLRPQYTPLFQVFLRNKEQSRDSIPELYVSTAKIVASRQSDGQYSLQINISDFDCGKLLYLYIFSKDSQIRSLHQLTNSPFLLCRYQLKIGPNDFVNFDCLEFTHSTPNAGTRSGRRQAYNLQQCNVRLEWIDHQKYLTINSLTRVPLDRIDVCSLNENCLHPAQFFEQQICSKQLNLLELYTVQVFSALRANGFSRLALTAEDWEKCAMVCYFGFSWVLFFSSVERKLGFVWAVMKAAGKHWDSSEVAPSQRNQSGKPCTQIAQCSEDTQIAARIDENCLVQVGAKKSSDTGNSGLGEPDELLKQRYIVQMDRQGILQYARVLHSGDKIPFIPQYDCVITELLSRCALNYSQASGPLLFRFLNCHDLFVRTGKYAIQFQICTFDGNTFRDQLCTVNYQQGKLAVGRQNVKVNDVYLYRSGPRHLLMYDVVAHDRLLLTQQEEVLEFIQQFIGVFQR